MVAEVERPERVPPTPDPSAEEAPTQEAPETAPQEADDQEEPEEKPPDLEALLEKADPEVLRKHKRIAGIAGEMAQKIAQREASRLAEQRAQEIVAERERTRAAEASRQQYLDAARKGEFYALGEQVSKDLLVDDQQRHLNQYQSQARTEAYQSVQAAVDEIANAFDPAVVNAASEAVGDFAPGTSWQDGFKRWLPELIKAQAAHLAANPETRKQVEREVTPAVRSRALAELNGAEPVADSGGGRPQKQKTITDEDIARMGPEDWEVVYDVDKGVFKPGYVYKPTRAINPRTMQTTGRGI